MESPWISFLLSSDKNIQKQCVFAPVLPHRSAERTGVLLRLWLAAPPRYERMGLHRRNSAGWPTWSAWISLLNGTATSLTSSKTGISKEKKTGQILCFSILLGELRCWNSILGGSHARAGCLSRDNLAGIMHFFDPWRGEHFTSL